MCVCVCAGAPCWSPSHVACPPRLKPARAHSPIVRSSLGNIYAGRTSMRNETSFTAPTAKKAGNNCQLGFFVPEPWQSMIVGHIILTHLACRTCRRCAVTEEEGDHVSENSGTPDCVLEILAHGAHCDIPPYGSIPCSRVCPPFSFRGSAGPVRPPP